ncbi:ArsR/SmtB family transcription factor [Hyphomonas sp.]|uniref:ArsR/SmtB family transcription factor n=1 Tax=Hyphomonas sp. TaxID=87 RepID=UPI00352986AF
MAGSSSMSGAEDQDTYWVLRKDQLECLASTVRMDVVDHLVGNGEMSIKQLATSMGRQPSSIYYHINMLLEAGLIVEAGTQVSNRRTEVLYAARAPRMRLQKALADPKNFETIARTVGAVSRQAHRDFVQGLTHPDAQLEGPGRNLGFFRLINRPSRESLQEINGYIERIAEILWEERDMDQPLIAFAWTLTPLHDKAESDE